ncbi:hypothetical protein BGX28_002712 [Mortierella sp. GBA30]|nr:hypothetical protein BGX28_002712 [Mortierella sp. GBA30]
MDNASFNGPQGGDSVDVLPPNDQDAMEDVHEDSHHRRSAYHEDDHRDYGHAADHERRSRDREQSLDRNHDSDAHRRDSHMDDSHRSREHDRDDKYDRHPSMNNNTHNDARPSDRRSRSRSPARGGGSGAVRDRRVYVGNLSYDVKWTHLKDFMREIGPVAHADVLLGHDGRSKGCGVVEYQNADDARAAIRKLNDVVLMGRPVFVREDRESEARIGFSGGRGGAGPAPSSRRDAGPSNGSTRQVFVGNLPYSVDWKDLKDLFRKAGPVDRADVFMNRDNRSKGSGTVSFDSAHDDKFGPPAGGSSRNAAPTASSSRYEPSRDHGRGGDSYGYDHGSSRGYRDEGSRGGRDHHGPDFYDGTRSSGHHGYGNDVNMAAVPSGPAAGSGDQIYIRNLPLTTTSQDLRDLFRTCGAIRMTEMLDTSGRSKGSGIVRFEMYESADKAVAKFNGYVYGGRPLEVMYDRA